MQKKDFVQRASIAFMAPLDFNLDRAVNYAVALWDRLSERGYGAAKPSGPRESVDWYGKLTAYQREWFDRFWKAFRYKQGRNEAAMVWHQMGEPSQAEYQRIVDAAAAEAHKPRDPGASRKMAQGWLSKRRYDDFTPPAQKPEVDDTPRAMRELMGELAQLKKLQKASPNEAQAQQILNVEKKIEALRGRQP
ncbi:MAG: hypothetical protein P8166_05960 [Candidatus Thiodiazotropha sp.]